MEIVTSPEKLPEENEKGIRALLLKSFRLTDLPPFDYCFTAIQDNEVIGSCATVRRSIAVAEKTHDLFLLGLLAIEENHRNRGSGSALLQYVITYHMNQRAEGIILNCGREKVSFYTANGFKVISEKAQYSRNGSIGEDNDPVLLYPYFIHSIQDYFTDAVFLGTDF